MKFDLDVNDLFYDVIQRLGKTEGSYKLVRIVLHYLLFLAKSVYLPLVKKSLAIFHSDGRPLVQTTTADRVISDRFFKILV